MTLINLLKYLWDGVDIPVTKEEIQQGVNELFEELRKGEINLQIEKKEPEYQRRIPNIYNNF